MAARYGAYATAVSKLTPEAWERRIARYACHDMMPPEKFSEVYAFVEPEIPFSSLTPD